MVREVKVDGMECRENAELLLRHAAGELDPENRARFERHTETCAACREAAQRQQAVWSSLDEWRAPAISSDFDARLAQRIAGGMSWWERLSEAMRPALIRRGLPVAAAAGLAFMAAVFLDRSDAVRTHQAPRAQPQIIRADQQESVVEDMQLLREIDRLAHPDSANSSM